MMGGLMMVTLTAFADEISPDLDEQLATLASENIRYIELRGVWGTNVARLTDEELDGIESTLAERGFRLSCVGSPIGKIGISDDFESHLSEFERVVKVAKRFEAHHIRIFSFFIPEGEDPLQYRDEVMSRLKRLVAIAEHHNVVLLHENEKHIYGDTAERCLDIMESCASPHLRMTFDPANFVQCGVRPYTTAYPLLAPYIEYIHIKDARLADGQVVPAGQGDGEVAPFLERMHAAGYDGFLSIEPHLASAGTFSGFSGPELFKVASRALKTILADISMPWR